jgi:predicted permease
MLQDLRYALRTLRHNPGFALVAIISLALGIGANTAVFSLANFLLLRPLPVPNPSGIVMVQSQFRGEILGGLTEYSPSSYPDFDDLRKKSNSFAGLTASQYLPFGFATDKTALPQMRYGALVSGNFFSVLGLTPELGRGFRPDEDEVPGRDAVAVLSDDLWKTEFASSPDVVGKTIFPKALPFTVVGVAPESFRGPNVMIRADLYVPLAMQPALAGSSQDSELEARGVRVLTIQGRLKPGVRVGQAAAEASVISRQLAQAYPETNRSCPLVVATYLQAQIEQVPTRSLLVVFMLGLAVVVLLIACANVMDLMLSRSSARSREVAVRLAIGAGRGRLIQQLLTESLVIAAFGGALGLLVAQAGARMFSQIRVPSDIPFVVDVKLDPTVLAFALLVSMASAIIFGLAPALKVTKPDLVSALKTGRTSDGKRPLWGRNALVIAQVAGSLLLLLFATQAYREASIVLSSPAGFRTQHMLLASFNPTLARDSMEQTSQFYRRLLDQGRTLPHVKSAALSQALPLLGGASIRVIPESVQLPPGTEALSVFSNIVSEGYFNTISVPVIEGREFQLTDRDDTERVAIINEQFVRKYYPSHNAVGKRPRLNGPDGLIAARDLAILEDDKHYFPPYQAVPMVRRETLRRHPAVRQALNELGGKISDAEMRQLNYAVDGEHRDVVEVVREFLRTKHLN